MLNRIRIWFWRTESLVIEFYVKHLCVKPSNKAHHLSNRLVVSLTSFPPRFNKLHLTLKGLLNQSVSPDKIVLWIATQDYDLLPEAVISLERNHEFFEIKTCRDLRSYKKLIPALIDFPDSFIVTADDDLYYPKKWLEFLIKNVNDTKNVIAHRVHRPKFKDSEFMPYSTWLKNARHQGGMLFPTGIGGVCYPPNIFSSEVFNEDKFMSICASADDVWFFWMTRLNGYSAKWSGYNISTVNWLGTDAHGLAKENIELSQNDVCINNMIKEYGLDVLVHNSQPS